MADSENPHLLVFPYPAQGHMLPLLDLSQNLATKGITITILTTPKNLPRLNPLLSNASSSNLPIKTLILPFPNTPTIPPGIENVQNLPTAYFRPMMRALSDLYEPLLNWFKTHPSPPIAILSDFFLGWTQILAAHLHIPRIVFSSSGAFLYSTICHLWLTKPHQSQNPDFPFNFPEIPNSPTFPWYQIPSLYRTYKQSDPLSEFIREGFLANLTSWGTVFNTFYDLEAPYLDHLREKNVGNGRVWAVGPVLPPEFYSETAIERGGSSSVDADKILEWLGLQEKHSVVYVCFGSQAVLSNSQMQLLALGLERSGVGFVWCMKEPPQGFESGKFGAVPAGFEERTKGRGLVIKGWAPQVLILKHSSVGAFFSHCGWNSVLEGLMCGVPFLAWPMTADQFVNARLLVEELGVGVRAGEGEEAMPDPDALALAMANVVKEEGSQRARAVELQDSALRSVRGGSSSQDLDGLVHELHQLKG